MANLVITNTANNPTQLTIKKGSEQWLFVADNNQLKITNNNSATGGIALGGINNDASGICSHAEGYDTIASSDCSHAEGTNTIASGNSSHAEGGYFNASGEVLEEFVIGDLASIISTTASGIQSHAEGTQTLTYGYSSHSEGYRTVASGEVSHAEGNSTVASGNSSHAEGLGTTASGRFSHAEGNSTVAFGDWSHAEGTYTTASGNSSHAEGYYTAASRDYSHAEGYGEPISIFITGAAKATTYTLSKANSNIKVGQIINYWSSSHFYATITDYDSSVPSITVDKTLSETALTNASATIYTLAASGFDSHAEGFETLASGDFSHAEGQNTTASGSGSHVEGIEALASGDFSHAEGSGTTASGNNSHTEGGHFNASGEVLEEFVIGDLDTSIISTTASGIQSHAEGTQTLAHGYSSHSEGYRTVASSSNSHAEGSETLASGVISHAEGFGTTAEGSYSHAEGYCTTAEGSYSHAEGCRTTVSGSNSHAEGYYTTASGRFSHAEGQNTTASGSGSHAEGGYFSESSANLAAFVIGDLDTSIISTTASGIQSHAEGTQTLAHGYSSHSEGYRTVASSSNSHAEGYYTTASGYYSHAEGRNTKASGSSSHAEGEGTKASSYYSHAEGNGTTASGSSSHAEGEGTKASRSGSHAEGYYTAASGNYSHAEGYSTGASGNYSHAEGNGTIASGSNSHAEGEGTKASGYSSHAEGNYAKAYGEASHAENDAVAWGPYSHAEGKIGSTTITISGGANVKTYNLPAKTVSYTVANASGTDNYGFSENSNGFWESQNQGINNSYALCTVTLKVTTTTNIVFDVINYAESSYDFALFSNLNTTLTASNIEDTSNVYYSFKGKQSSTIQQVTYSNVPAGTHTIQIKFRKDTSQHNNYDSVQFRMPDDSNIVNNSLGKRVSYNGIDAVVTNYNANNRTITFDKTLSSTALSNQIIYLYSNAYGRGSHVGGYDTTAYGEYQTVIGRSNKTDNSSAFIIGNGTSSNYSNALTVGWDGTVTASKVYGAVWNDYAEYRNQIEIIEPGYCVASQDNGQVYKTNEKFQSCDGIVSDTFGFAIGETKNYQTPIAVAGRVLAYCEGNKYDYHAGDTVCAGPNGKVCKMTREEICEWPDRIVGIVSEIPEYNTWGSGNIKVNGRIWIKVK